LEGGLESLFVIENCHFHLKMQIENCDPNGQTLRSCLNAQYKRDEDIPDACKAGSAVVEDIQIACNYQVQNGSREG
jgi:hypothetical protein